MESAALRRRRVVVTRRGNQRPALCSPRPAIEFFLPTRQPIEYSDCEPRLDIKILQ